MIADAKNAVKRIPRALSETGTLILNHKDTIPYFEHIRGLRVFKSHSYPTKINISKVKIVTVLRDPRDVIVSSIFYLASLEKKYGGWGEEFRNKTVSGRIEEVIQTGDFLLTRLEAWHEDENSYKMQYEQLLAGPEKEMAKLFEFLGLEVSNRELREIVIKNSFEKKTGRKRGDENSKSFHRKGIKGDWRNYFDEDCISMFKTEKEGRWNKLLVSMGYEDTLNWHSTQKAK